ncbi:MAG: transposase [Ktedonobacteraceae bacterium]
MGYHPFNPRQIDRKPLRLPNRDYAAASAYFVTICTDHRTPLFDIPELHKIVVDNWVALPARFPSVTFDEFVVMPDHVHFILWLSKQEEANEPELSQVIGAYKSLIAVAWLNHIKKNHLNCSGKVWQKSFNDHIIRFGELEQKRCYIRNNPAKLKKSEMERSDM